MCALCVHLRTRVCLAHVDAEVRVRATICKPMHADSAPVSARCRAVFCVCCRGGQITKKTSGAPDYGFLEKSFHKLLLNFAW